MSKDCTLTVVNCDFHCAGCEVQLPRKDMPAHLAENLVIHVSQLANYTHAKNEEIAALKLTLTDMESEITQLKARPEEYSSLKEVKEKPYQQSQGETIRITGMSIY